MEDGLPHVKVEERGAKPQSARDIPHPDVKHDIKVQKEHKHNAALDNKEITILHVHLNKREPNRRHLDEPPPNHPLIPQHLSLPHIIPTSKTILLGYQHIHRTAKLAINTGIVGTCFADYPERGFYSECHY